MVNTSFSPRGRAAGNNYNLISKKSLAPCVLINVPIRNNDFKLGNGSDLTGGDVDAAGLAVIVRKNHSGFGVVFSYYSKNTADPVNK